MISLFQTWSSSLSCQRQPCLFPWPGTLLQSKHTIPRHRVVRIVWYIAMRTHCVVLWSTEASQTVTETIVICFRSGKLIYTSYRLPNLIMGESSLTNSFVLHLKSTILVLNALSSIIRSLVNSVWRKLCTRRKRIKWRVQCTVKCRYNAGKQTSHFNTLRPRENSRRFADDTFKRIFLNENARISIKISLKFVPMGPINNIQALVQIMAWRRSGDKPLSEPMMVSLSTHLCVTRPQWVNNATAGICLSKRIVRHSCMHAI